MTDITTTSRPDQRIDNCMCKDIRIGMTIKPLVIVNPGAANDQGPALTKGMNIKALPDSVIIHGYPPPCVEYSLSPRYLARPLGTSRLTDMCFAHMRTSARKRRGTPLGGHFPRGRSGPGR